MAIFDAVTNELITDENEVLSTTLKYNIGLVNKNDIAQQDIAQAIDEKNITQNRNDDTTKG